jgi:endonuclease/exonuclease/phosphatase family metal-dependent hydrolase
VSTNKKVINEIDHSISIYVKRENVILESDVILEKDKYVGSALFTKIKSPNKILNIASVHGVAQPGDKLDNPKRLQQSQKIIEYMAKIDGVKIIGGDFNLDKNTESVKMFEKNGYRNLIEEYKIETTRNHLCWDVWHNVQLWADFLFVSPEVKVKSFEVPKNEVSDHLPQVVEIED